MVVDDLDIVGPVVAPDEADAPPVVDADAVLALAVVLERFQPVTRRKRSRKADWALSQKFGVVPK